MCILVRSRWSRRWKFYRTASGEWIPDGGAWQFQGYDENGLCQTLNGRKTHGVPTTFCAVWEKGRFVWHSEANGGSRIEVCEKCRS